MRLAAIIGLTALAFSNIALLVLAAGAAWADSRKSMTDALLALWLLLLLAVNASLDLWLVSRLV